MKNLEHSLDNGLIGLLLKTLLYSALLVFFIWSSNYGCHFWNDILLAIGDTPDEVVLRLAHNWQFLFQNSAYLLVAFLGLVVPYLIGFTWTTRQLVISYKQLVTVLKSND